MSEWLSYRLSDFLLFSEQTYFRLFSLYNQHIWPMQFIGVALGIVLTIALFRLKSHRGRIVSGVLAMMWLWIAWAYLFEHYATINWAAPAIAVLFFLQAFLLIVIGLIRDELRLIPPRRPLDWLSVAIMIYALAVHPLLAPLVRGTWWQTELIGVTPDPTVIATLGVMGLAIQRRVWLLMVIPIFWCLLSAATLLAMDDLQGWIPLFAAVLGISLSLSKDRT